ncbi:MAG: hypothetical protein Q7U39_18685 [Nitrospira sp.]|nr:hypothetical protein [Nitrospira sp.]
MALQIRRAHQFFSSPQDLIALSTSNGTNREKGPGTYSILRIVGGLTLCLSQLFSAPNAESAEKWLIYSEAGVFPDSPNLLGHFYYGYYEVPENEIGAIDISARTHEVYQKILNKDKEIKKAKPIITRKDDGYLLLYLSGMDKPLICTKAEAAFKQSDAPVVPSDTLSNVKGITSINQEQNGKVFPCDLETRDKGNTRITFTVEKQLTDTTKGELLKGTVLVHELYRFRIISGPVFSSLITKNRTYSTLVNAGGQTVISSSRTNDAPVNFPLFLKCYCFSKDGRDILVNPPYLTWEGFRQRVNPIVGINLVDNPFKNFYAGFSFEPVLGVDIVAGAHFAKIDQLAGGFSDGQVVAAGTQPPTTSKFLTGGFVGVTADVGVIGSWLGSQITKTIKEGLR